MLADAGLVAGALAGDDQCFNQLVLRHWDAAVGLAEHRRRRRGGGRGHRPGELRRAYPDLRMLRDPGRFVGWVCGIVEQGCVDHLRRRGRDRVARRRPYRRRRAGHTAGGRKLGYGGRAQAGSEAAVARLGEPYRRVVGAEVRWRLVAAGDRRSNRARSRGPWRVEADCAIAVRPAGTDARGWTRWSNHELFPGQRDHPDLP